MKWQSHIIKYLKGDLSREEQWQLEKEALDDDFLAEAWEGYVLQPNAQHEVRLRSLEQSIHTPKGRRVIRFKQLVPFAAAAAVLISVSTYFLLKDSAKDITNDLVVMQTSEESEQVASSFSDIDSDARTLNPPVAVDVAQEENKPSKYSNSTNSRSKLVDETNINSASVDSKKTITPTENASNQHVDLAILGEKDGAFSNDLSKATGTQPSLLLAAVVEKSLPADQESTSFKASVNDSPSFVAQGAKEVGSISRSEIIVAENNVIALTLVNENDDQGLTPHTFEPKIGLAAFLKELGEKTIITREWLFMRGISVPQKVVLSFELTEQGLPIKLKILTSSALDDVNKEAIRLMNLGHEWRNDDLMIKELTFELEFPLIKN